MSKESLEFREKLFRREVVLIRWEVESHQFGQQKFSIHSLHISDDVDFSMVLRFVCMNQGRSF